MCIYIYAANGSQLVAAQTPAQSRSGSTLFPRQWANRSPKEVQSQSTKSQKVAPPKCPSSLSMAISNVPPTTAPTRAPEPLLLQKEHCSPPWNFMEVGSFLQDMRNHLAMVYNSHSQNFKIFAKVVVSGSYSHDSLNVAT